MTDFMRIHNLLFARHVDNEVVVWLLDFFRDHSATLIMVSVDPFHLNHIRIDDGDTIDVCSDEGQKRVEFILAQYGMGSEEAMEMVLNAICTYTKGITETFLKGVPMA